jgi:hypothetical protein
MILIIIPNSSKRFVVLINIHFKKPNSCTSLCLKIFNNTIHPYYPVLTNFILNLIISSSNTRTHCNQKGGTPRMLPGTLTDPPPRAQLCPLRGTVCLLFPWLTTARGLLCRTTQCNLRSHRWRVRTSCLTTQQTIRSVISD